MIAEGMMIRKQVPLIQPVEGRPAPGGGSQTISEADGEVLPTISRRLDGRKYCTPFCSSW